MKKFSTAEIIYLVIAIVIVVIGLKLTSVGIGPATMIQSDGYNVTGGFIALIGGFMLGGLFAKKRK